MAAASACLTHSAFLPASLSLGTAISRSRAIATACFNCYGLVHSHASSGATFSLSSGDRRTRQKALRSCGTCPRAALDSDQASTSETSDVPPPGCSRVKVELSRPLGIAFEETKIGTIIVGDVIPGGNAECSGLVQSGDQLIATSAIIYADSDEYQGVTVRKGMQKVRLNVRGERFETVMAAIGTHPAYIKVMIELQKCEPGTTNGAATNGAAIDQGKP